MALPPLVATLKAEIGSFSAKMAEAKAELKAVEGAGNTHGAALKNALQTHFSAAGSSTSGLTGQLKGLVGGLGEMSPAMMAVGGGALALAGGLVAAAGAGIEKFQTQTGEVRKLKGALGSTAEEASGLRNVAVALGMDTDSLTRGMVKLSVNLAKTGGDIAGVHVEIAKGADGNTNMVRTLDNVRKAYQGIEDPAQRNEFLLKAMGKAGAELRPIMSLTNAEFDKFKNRGAIFSQSDLDSGRNLAIAQRDLGAATDKLEISLAKGLAPALTEVATGFADLVNGADNLTSAVGGLGGAIGIAFEAGKFLTPIGAAQKAWTGLSGLWSGDTDQALNTLTFGLEGSNKAAEQSADAAKNQMKAYKDAGGVIDETVDKDGELSAAHKKLADQIGATATSIDSAYSALGGSAAGLGGTENALALEFINAKNAADELKMGLDALIGVHISADLAAIKVQTDIASLTKSFADNGATVDINSEAGRKNRQQADQTALGILAEAEALGREHASADVVNATLGAHIEQLRRVLAQTGMTTEEIQAYIDRLHLVPPTVETHVLADLAQAWDGLSQVEVKLNQLSEPRMIELSVQLFGADRAASTLAGLRADTGNIDPRGHAQGGFIDSPEIGLIGEAGRELILPLTNMPRTMDLLAQAGLVRPFASSGSMSYPTGDAMGGTVVNIAAGALVMYAAPGQDAVSFANDVHRALLLKMRRTGPLGVS